MLAQRLQAREYAVVELQPSASPRLLVYRTRVEQNISLMRQYLESVVPSSGFRHLAPHVKTHKSAWVTSLLLGSGVRKLKCTLEELDMLLELPAEEIFVAYPLLPEGAERVVASAARQPERRIVAQVGSLAHVESLASAARRLGHPLDVLIDLNVGLDRTGASPGAVSDVARGISRQGSLRLRGIHAYAGHNVSADPAERVACARKSMAQVVECISSVEALGARVEQVVVSGTPGFLDELRELVVTHRVDAEVLLSPGTWIYWDGHSESLAPGMFEFAALLQARVIDLPADGLATLNLGSKRWSVDKGPLSIFSIPGLEVVSTHEEHTVLRVPDGTPLAIGDRVLAAPQHVCPTVNLWEHFAVVGDDGRIERPAEPVTARNR